jgi:hypothetical protein
MINPGHKRLSIVRQCELVSISRASFYRQPASESEENLDLMRLIDEAFLEAPWYGTRQMAASNARGLVHRPQARAASDEEDRPGADLSGAEDERAAPAAQDLPVPAAAHDDRAAEPGLVRRWTRAMPLLGA